jgi:hypothetical protein
MVLRQRFRIARRVAAIGATLAMIGGGLSVATPAYAVTEVSEGFEGAFPYDVWGIVESQPRSMVYLGNHASRNTGNNLARLHGTNDVYAQIYSRYGVVLERPGPQPICGASVMMTLSAQSLANPATRNATVYLRLWAGTARNVPPLSEIVHRVSHGEPYELYRFGGFAFQPNTPIYFEISVTNGIVLVDDVFIRCIKQPT